MNDSSFDRSRIALSHEEMRKFGYRVVDLLAEHFSNMERGPVGASEEQRDQTQAAGERCGEENPPAPTRPALSARGRQ